MKKCAILASVFKLNHLNWYDVFLSKCQPSKCEIVLFELWIPSVTLNICKMFVNKPCK